MKTVVKFKNFTILLLCVLFMNSCCGANASHDVGKANNPVANFHNNLVVRDMLIVSSILQSIPIVGAVLDGIYSMGLNFVMMFEYTTNNLLDKILRDTLPCTISASSVYCEGVYKNGGINSILRRAVDSMPDTTPLYIIKKVLGVLLCYLNGVTMDPLVIFGSFLLQSYLS